MLVTYRTLIWSLIIALFGVLETFEWTTVLDAPYAGMVVMAMGAITMYLRSQTTLPWLSK